MPDKLADMFNPSWFRLLAAGIKSVYPSFKDGMFLKACIRDLEPKALNARMRHASESIKEFLPLEFPDAVEVLEKVIGTMPRGYTSLVFPDFVGQYGHAHFDLSMKALGYFTKFGSSEFAIREFLRKDFDRTIRVMYKWAKSDDMHVRRLASEGSRPRLPWSFKLDRLIEDPSPTRPILDALSSDPELYVRKSVANHLNDISKFNPSYMLELCASWDAADPRTAWIIRHASRTLIKKGHQGSLAALNFEKNPKFALGKVKISPKQLKIGERLEFAFQLRSQKNRPQKLAIDYRIHYKKKNGSSVKTFKLKECELLPGATIEIKKNHMLADLSTRRHYPGQHIFELQVNGRIVHRAPFRLTT